jgi:hypothetical protein
VNPRRNTLLRHKVTGARGNGVVAVLTNQVFLGGQLVAIYDEADVTALQSDGPAPTPKRIAFVDFLHATADRYQRIGNLVDAASRVLGEFSPGVSAIKSKVLLEPIERSGRNSGRYAFDSTWTTAQIMAQVDRGVLSIVPLFSEQIDVGELGEDIVKEVRTMQARQKRAVASGNYYVAVAPHDDPFRMLELLPAAKAAKLSAIYEVEHQLIDVDLIWSS